MPAGSLSTVDRVKTLQEMRKLVDEGKSNAEIASIMNLSMSTVANNRRYLLELASESLTPEILGNKRSELYLDLVYATQESRDLFEKYRDNNDGINAKRFLDAYIQSIIERARLYGIYTSAEAGVTINQQFNNFVPDNVNTVDGARIADIIKNSHERTVAAKYKERAEEQQE